MCPALNPLNHIFGLRIIPVAVPTIMSEPFAPNMEYRLHEISEPSAPSIDDTYLPVVHEPNTRRNRWQRSRCSQRPPGKDHSLGFPTVERGGDGESSSSEVILFQSPIIDVDPQFGSMAPSSSSALPSISELKETGNPSPKGASTPMFGTKAEEEDPWAAQEEPVPGDMNVNNLRPTQSSRTDTLDYRAQIWRCLRAGEDPWYTE